jgi:hypothetical protein
MNAAHALDNLRLVRDVLATHGARSFLVDGTLLGAVREGGFIAHDTDVDTGCFIGDLRPAVLPALVRAGFRVHRRFGAPKRGYQWSLKRHKIKTDVFFYYTDRHGRYHAAWQKKQPIRYSYWRFDLAPIEFMGEAFLAPDDPERFLMTKYGPGWREPVTEWDWAWGPRNATAWGTVR